MVSSVRSLPHSRQLPAALHFVYMCASHATAFLLQSRYVDIQEQDIRTSESRAIRYSDNFLQVQRESRNSIRLEKRKIVPRK